MENTKTKIVAVANQKGGVAKTTSAFNIAAILAQREKRVLMIDLDPQSSLSVSCMKYEYDPDDITITELMSSIINKKTIDFKTAVHHNEPNNIDYIPATITLSGIEVDLCRTRCCEMVLKRVISNYIGCYDYIIIDCPPSLSNLLYNALSAADMVLIPVLAQEMALSGIPLLLDSISKSKAAQDSSREGIALCNYKISSTNKYKNMLADEYRVIADKIECVTVTH